MSLNIGAWQNTIHIGAWQGALQQRPKIEFFEHGFEFWDLLFQHNFNQCFINPFSVPNGPPDNTWLSGKELPAASSSPGSIASINEGETWVLYFSDGTDWHKLG